MFFKASFTFSPNLFNYHTWLCYTFSIFSKSTKRKLKKDTFKFKMKLLQNWLFFSCWIPKKSRMTKSMGNFLGDKGPAKRIWLDDVPFGSHSGEDSKNASFVCWNAHLRLHPGGWVGGGLRKRVCTLLDGEGTLRKEL